jgi:hypothetical protein
MHERDRQQRQRRLNTRATAKRIREGRLDEPERGHAVHTITSAHSTAVGAPRLHPDDVPDLKAMPPHSLPVAVLALALRLAVLALATAGRRTLH